MKTFKMSGVSDLLLRYFKLGNHYSKGRIFLLPFLVKKKICTEPQNLLDP